MPVLSKTPSDHGIIWAGKDVKDHLVPPPYCSRPSAVMLFYVPALSGWIIEQCLVGNFLQITMKFCP